MNRQKYQKAIYKHNMVSLSGMCMSAATIMVMNSAVCV